MNKNELTLTMYVAAKEMVRMYKPYLDRYDITYTQYITLNYLWEVGTSNVKALGEKLYLDSGTLTPLLKKLEKKGLVTRNRSKEDERSLVVSCTETGLRLKDELADVARKVEGNLNITDEESSAIEKLLAKITA